MPAKARRGDSEWTRVRVGDVDLKSNIFASATGCALTMVYTSQQLDRLGVGWALTAIAVTHPTAFEHTVVMGVHTDFDEIRQTLAAHPLNPAVLVSGDKCLDVYRLCGTGFAYTAAAFVHLRTGMYNDMTEKASSTSRTLPEYYYRMAYVPAVYAAAERVLHFLWPDWQRVVFNYRAVAELSGCAERDEGWVPWNTWR